MSPANPNSAEAILQRLLVVLPLAARDEGEGASIEELARDLAVEPRRLLRDLEEVQGRSYYLPAGLGEKVQLTLTRERLHVWTTGEFRRPVRLTPREAVALELALRVVASGGPEGDRPGFEMLRKRIVGGLRSPAADGVEAPPVAFSGVGGEGTHAVDPVRATVEAALWEGRVLRIRYRPSRREPAWRRVGPVVMAHAEGRWYLLARDLDAEGLRAFRLDRTVSAEATDIPFAATERDRLDAEEFFRDGRIHDGGGQDAPDPFEAVVEYSPRIARWIREQGWDHVEDIRDGGLRVRHSVVDPEWLVRHVLSYGAEARIVEPEWVGGLLRERLVHLVEGRSDVGE
jgi:proteasome accessory factor C